MTGRFPAGPYSVTAHPASRLRWNGQRAATDRSTARTRRSVVTRVRPQPAGAEQSPRPPSSHDCPHSRSSAGQSTRLSSEGSRVRVPSTAPSIARCGSGPSSTWPNGHGAGVRSRRLQVRLLPSTPQQHLAVAQRMRAPPSDGGGRTFESCQRGQPSDARWSNGKTSGCYPEGGGSSPSLAAHLWQHRSTTRWPRSEARGRRPRDEGANPSRVSIAIRCDGVGLLPTKQHPADWEVRCKPEGQELAVPNFTPTGSRIAHVVVVQWPGRQRLTLKTRVRLPPTTPLARCDDHGSFM